MWLLHANFPFRVRKQVRFITKWVRQASHLILQLLNTLSSHRGHVKYRTNSTLQIHERKNIWGCRFSRINDRALVQGSYQGYHNITRFPFLTSDCILDESYLGGGDFFLCRNHYGILIAAKCNVNPCDLNDVPLICSLLIKV